MRRLAVSALITLLLGPAVAHARSLEDRLGDAAERVRSPTFRIVSGSEFEALAENIADTAARSLPVISSSAGFTYRYNPTTEVFERTSQTLGPLFLERPDTLGRGKFNVSVSFQYVEFNTFDGTDLTDLANDDPIVIRARDASGTPIGFRGIRLRYSLGLQNYIHAVSFTYGVLDDLDLNLLLPVIVTNMRIGVHAQEVATAGLDRVFSPSSGPEFVGRDDGDAVGIGDILLRAKYQLPRTDWLRSAVGLQLRLPSGRSEDFQGTGDFEMSPFVAISSICWNRVEPHANLAFDVNTMDASRSAVRYGLGVDVDVTPIFNVSIGYLGRSEFDDSADASDTQFRHLRGGTTVREPLLGLDFDRKDTSDLTFGFRVVVWRNLMVFANGIYALEDSGLRNDTIIPAGGVEGTF
jgi:hypothetical protein